MKQHWSKATPTPRHKNQLDRELEASTHSQSEILQSPFQGISGGKALSHTTVDKISLWRSYMHRCDHTAWNYTL